MLSNRPADRLRDSVEDAQLIARFIEGMTPGEFVADERTRFAFERPPQRIAEAATQIDPADMAMVGTAMPVPQMWGLGNRPRPEYRDLDRTMIFETARIEVPALAVDAALLPDGGSR